MFWLDKDELILVSLRLGVIILSLITLVLIGKLLLAVKTTLIVITLSLFFAYLLMPLVDLIERRLKVGRTLAISLTYIMISVALSLLGLSLAPYLSAQLSSFLRDLPNMLEESLQNLLSSLSLITEHLSKVNVNWEAVMERVYLITIEAMRSLPLQTITLFFNTFMVVVEGFLISVITFYTLKDYSHIKASLLSLTGRSFEPYLEEFESTLSGFVRGQLIAGTFVLALVTITLSIAKVKYSLVIGLLAGLFELIPFVGAFLGFTLSIIVGFSKGLWVGLFVMVILIIGYQILAKVIYPNVVGRILKLSPTTILIVILVGAEIGGLIGMFIAVPLTALLKRWLYLSLKRTADGSYGGG